MRAEGASRLGPFKSSWRCGMRRGGLTSDGLDCGQKGAMWSATLWRPAITVYA